MQLVKHRQVDMLSGPVLKNIIIFAIPLVLTNLLSHLYASADSIVAGRMAGDGALAAIGASAPPRGLLSLFGSGLVVGASVEIAHAIGAGDRKKVFHLVHTAIAMALLIGGGIGVLSIVLTKPMLVAMDTPADILSDAVLYMQITMGTYLFSLAYSMISTVMCAAGNTIKPMVIGLTSGLVNLVLNIILVQIFHNVACVAVATAVSQLLSMIWGGFSLMRSESDVRLFVRSIHIHGPSFKAMLTIGLPSAAAGVVLTFANLMVQTGINTFPAICGTGNVASANVEGYILLIVAAFSTASTTFISQNYGAGQYTRIRKIERTCLLMMLVMGGIMSIVCNVFGEQLIGLFNDNPEAIRYGMYRMRIEGSTYFLVSMAGLEEGLLRGIGHPHLPMIVSVLTRTGVQTLWIVIVFRMLFPTSPEALFMCYPVSTVVNFVTLLIVAGVAKRKLPKTDTPPQTEESQEGEEYETVC